MKSVICFTSFLFCLAAAKNRPHPTTCQPSAVIHGGTILGVATTLPSSTVTVNKFLGIPYAEPPLGSKRFLPPIPHAHFGRHPFNASQWGHVCYQQNKNTSDIARESEDCLTLNVYAPASRSRAKRPVLLWIHGGDLKVGGAAQKPLDGTSFSTYHDIVVVTIQYRLNAFGFPNSPALPLTDNNLAFLDQRLALDWVHKNIHAFNGDPDKVTLGGESSGASSVDRLVDTSKPPLIPKFRAAGESSGQASVSPFERKSGPVSWATLAVGLGCNNTSSRAELVCMQAVDALTIRSFITDNNLDFSPVNDGITQVELPYLNNRAAGKAAHVPLLIGTSAQEGTSLADTYGLDIPSFSEDDLAQLISFFTGGNQTAMDQFSNIVHLIMQTDGLSIFYAAAQLYTEIVFQCPAKLVSRASEQSGLPVWRYYHNASFPNIHLGDIPSSELGAYHTGDLQLIWGTYPTEGATPQEVGLSKTIQASWASFVKDPWGEGPGWGRIDSNGSGLACFGCDGGTDFTLIDEQKVDARCPYYEEVYATVKTPSF